MRATAEMVEEAEKEVVEGEGGESVLSYFQFTDGDINRSGLTNGSQEALMPTVTIVVWRDRKKFSGCAAGENIISATALAIERATGVKLEIIKFKTFSKKNAEDKVVYYASLKFVHETFGLIAVLGNSMRGPNGAIVSAFLNAANEVKAAFRTRR